MNEICPKQRHSLNHVGNFFFIEFVSTIKLKALTVEQRTG